MIDKIMGMVQDLIYAIVGIILLSTIAGALYIPTVSAVQNFTGSVGNNIAFVIFSVVYWIVITLAILGLLFLMLKRARMNK